jgi:hypothetical protein
MRSDGEIIAMTPICDNIFGALRFASGHGSNLVLLKMNVNDVCANVFEVAGPHDLYDVIPSFNKINPNEVERRSWEDEPDRILRELSIGYRLCVVLQNSSQSKTD